MALNPCRRCYCSFGRHAGLADISYPSAQLTCPLDSFFTNDEATFRRALAFVSCHSTGLFDTLPLPVTIAKSGRVSLRDSMAAFHLWDLPHLQLSEFLFVHLKILLLHPLDPTIP